ncbi:MAG: hypothetical protein ACI4J3_01670 [Oscillospiraceae bacterium]
MARKRRILAAALSLYTALLLGGCQFSMTVDTLLSPPRLTEQQEQIYQALQTATGNNISLKYPKSGERLSAFTVEDLDADGENEAIVFYEVSMASAEENPLRFCLLDCENGVWRAITDYTTPGAAVECVIVSQLGSNDRTNLIIGYSMVNGGGYAVEVFHYGEDTLERTLTVPYTKMDINDLNGDGTNELLVVNAATLSAAASAAVYALDENGSYYQSRISLNGLYSDISRIVYGRLPYSDPSAGTSTLRCARGIYIDGVSGATTVQTEVLLYENQQLIPVYADSAERFPGSTRSSVCPTFDIDNDGEAEIPVQTVFYGYSEAADSERIAMTNWYVCRNGTLMREYSSYYSANDGYAFLLPSRWEKAVTVVQEFGTIVFYVLDTEQTSAEGRPVVKQPLLRLAVVSDAVESNALQQEGYLLLRQQNGNNYLAKIEQTDRTLLLTQSELLFAMRYL